MTKRRRRSNPTPAGGRVPRREWRAFKTGLSYNGVRQMLWSSDDDSSHWRYKRRGTVLGMFHAIKVELWNYANQRTDRPGMLVVEGTDAGADVRSVRRALRGARVVEIDDDDVPF